MNNFKVVFLLRYWAVYGGGETVTIALANEFVRRGLDVSILYLWDNVRSEMPYIDERIKAVRIAGDKNEDLQITDKKLSVKLHDYIQENDIGFVINQWWLAETAYFGTRGTDAILIKCHHISVQGSWNIKVHDLGSFLKYLLGPIYVKISKYLQVKAIDKFYKMSDYVSFLAPSYVKEYNKLTTLKIDKDRTISIFNPQVFEVNLPVEKYKQKQNVALFVGRMQEAQKGLKRLMDVWKLVEQSGKCNNWTLVMVGTGEDLESTKMYAKSLGLTNISFEGFQQPNSYYAKAKIFMMTSKTEGLPMTLIEAKQSMVCPIVMDTFSSLHDVITNGKDGIIVDENIEEMANKFISLVENPQLLEKLGSDTSVTGRFSVIKIVDQWLDLFNNATKKLS